MKKAAQGLQSHLDFADEKVCTALCASMCACVAHFDARSVISVFCDAHVAAENRYQFIRACGRELCEALYTVKKAAQGAAFFDGNFILCTNPMI